MSGNDFWSDYNRGAAGLPPREGMFYNMAERAGADSQLRNQNNGGGNAGAGIAGLFILGAALAAIVAIAAAAAVSAVLALPAAYLLIGITALFTGGQRLNFTDAYKTSFVGLTIAAALALALCFLAAQGYFMALQPTVEWLLAGAPGFAALSSSDMALLVPSALLLIAPGIVAFALVLGRRLDDPYVGGLGILRAFAASVVVLVLPMIALGAAAVFVAAHGEIAVRSNELGTFLTVALGFVLVMAVVGGLLLGLALMAFGGGLTKGGPMFRTAWFTGAVAMAISGGTTAMAILFFRDGDGMLIALIALTGVGSANPPTFLDAAPGFLKLVAPGAIAAAVYVAGNLYAYRGIGGWAKAFLITVPIALAGLAGTVMAMAQLR